MDAVGKIFDAFDRGLGIVVSLITSICFGVAGFLLLIQHDFLWKVVGIGGLVFSFRGLRDFVQWLRSR